MRLPQSNILPIKYLSSIFNNTTNSYKFYWFVAILEYISAKIQPVIPLQELSARMIARAWYPVNYFNISFGKQDRLAIIAFKVKAENQLNENAKEHDVLGEVLRILNHSKNTEILKDLDSLIRYVPYRFLRPWFTKELRGIADYEINPQIVKLAEQGFENQSELCLYKFVGKEEKAIEIQRNWFEYLQKHNKILMDFCSWNLLIYLQKNNPNVPNIAEKLFAPKNRKLRNARRFWDFVLKEQEAFYCIYSQVPVVVNEYSIDHFIPWKFVTHDQLWNLIPVPKFINFAKSDFLPSLDQYFGRFARVHYQAFRLAFKKNKLKILEDYTTLYQSELTTIYQMPEHEFKYRLRSAVAPLVQIAENMGFESNWIYKK
ncbi:MAG: HNH endonuclease domain-containing protein [bacterium]